MEVAGVEPASKKREVEARYRLGPVLVTSAGMPDDPDRGRAPWSRPPSGGVAAAHPVPSSGRPKSPVGRFNEPGTRRSRGLARHCCLRGKGEGRSAIETNHIFGVFVFIGLMRGPTDEPPPAPRTATATCRNHVTPGPDPSPPHPSGPGWGRSNSMDCHERDHNRLNWWPRSCPRSCHC